MSLKAIRLKCIDCCCGQLAEVRLCPCNNCPLWPYRMGKRPKTQADRDETEKREKAPVFSSQNENSKEALSWTE